MIAIFLLAGCVRQVAAVNAGGSGPGRVAVAHAGQAVSMAAVIRELALVPRLAAIMAGETPGCPAGQLAVGQVFQNRVDAGIDDGWYGWAKPGGREIILAMLRRRLPDVARGAVYAIQPSDRANNGMPFLQKRVAVFSCPGNDLEIWR